MTNQPKKKTKLSEKISIPRYTLGEELMNAITHGIGAGLSIAATVLCIVRAALHHSAKGVVSSCIYGASLLVLYLVSTIYHALRVNNGKRVFRILDHCSIFLLIAGTYTPFALLVLPPAWGWTIFGIIWAAAIVGIVFNAIDVQRYARFSMTCYLLMGWLIIIAFKVLYQNLAWNAVILLIAGGVVYSIGAILYGIGSKKRYIHSIWHFFVIGGSILHFFAIYLYVL
ncbi:MAG: hemolysin III family protein [Lachnospiraceae bacterium]